MPIIEIDILNTLHKVACGDGEETRLRHLSTKVNEKLKHLASLSPRASDLKLLIVNAIQMENEIQDLKSSSSSSLKEKDHEEIVSKTLDAVNEYVDGLANRLKKL